MSTGEEKSRGSLTLCIGGKRSPLRERVTIDSTNLSAFLLTQPPLNHRASFLLLILPDIPCFPASGVTYEMLRVIHIGLLG